MNKYDELIERAKRFTDTAIVGELINAVSELKDREDVVRCCECKYGEIDDPDFPYQYFCRASGDDWNEGEHFCSYGERKDNG